MPSAGSRYIHVATHGFLDLEHLRADRLRVPARDRAAHAFHPSERGAWVLIR